MHCKPLVQLVEGANYYIFGVNYHNNLKTAERVPITFTDAEDDFSAVHSMIAMYCPTNAIYGQGSIQNTDWL